MRFPYDWKGDGRYDWKYNFPTNPPPKKSMVVKPLPTTSGAPKGHLDKKKN